MNISSELSEVIYPTLYVDWRMERIKVQVVVRQIEIDQQQKSGIEE